MSATQLSLPDAPRFNGAAYDRDRDDERMTGQLLRVWRAVKDGCWWTPAELERATGDNWSSISAQLRHLRKPRFGQHDVERRHVMGGLFEYRVIPNPNAEAVMAAAAKKSHHKKVSV